MSSDSADSLRDALDESSGSSFGDRALRASLVSAVSVTPRLRAVATDYLQTSAVELDVHLDGQDAANHKARADRLGTFLNRAAIAVKELAKDIGGLKAHRIALNSLAPSPGSVRLVLSVDKPTRPQRAIPGTDSTLPLDGQALQLLSGLLMQADSTDSPLDTALHQLHGPARSAVRRLAQTALDANWTVEGDLRIKGGPSEHMRLTPAGALRLVLAARVTESELSTTSMVGHVDGWRWSTSTMSFEPDHGRPIWVAVPPQLKSEVAAVLSDEENRVRVGLNVRRTYPAGDSASPRSEFSLANIQGWTEPELQAPFTRAQLEALRPKGELGPGPTDA